MHKPGKPNSTYRFVPRLTRNEFLKTMGVSAAGILAGVPLLFRMQTSPSLKPQVPLEDLERGFQIAAGDGMVQDSLIGIRSLGFTLSIADESLVSYSAQEDLLGLVLRHQSSSSRRTGADLIATVDLGVGLVTMVQVIVGWSYIDTIDVASMIYDIRLPLYEEPYEGRLGHPDPPVWLRPRLEQQWVYYRPDSPPIRPEDLLEVGWPPDEEAIQAGYWYYGGCSGAEWVLDQETYLYRGVQLVELREPEQRQLITLEYDR
jgi:hypothetical protein